jgi:AbrB family looped-hinge helix DNA binding protein
MPIFPYIDKEEENGMSPIHVKISDNGRLSIPAAMRKAIGLERGGDVVIELSGQEIRIRTLAEATARARELTRRLLAGRTDASVDDFIAERREEASREEEE